MRGQFPQGRTQQARVGMLAAQVQQLMRSSSIQHHFTQRSFGPIQQRNNPWRLGAGQQARRVQRQGRIEITLLQGMP